MRKSMFLALSAMVLLAGCSKENEVIIDNGGNEGDEAPVLIQLGGTNSIESNTTASSRAALDAWNNTNVGVLGLAENAAAGTYWDIATYNSTCILNNVQGTIATAGDAQAINIGTGHYYPLDNTTNYTFYGYHPYASGTGNNNITADAAANKVTVTYTTFDGTQDILWGKVKATQITGTDKKDYQGFNARYFRKMQAPKTDPNIVFDHKLVRLKFKISGGEGEIQNLKVTSIKLIKVPTSVSLIVADLPNTNEGKIQFDQTTVDNGKYTLKKNDADAADEINLHDGTNPVNKVQMGESIMVPAEAVINGNYTAEVQLAFKTPGSTINPSPITITPPTGKNFTAGNAYNINITINGLTDIKITATLAAWGDGGDSDLEIN